MDSETIVLIFLFVMIFSFIMLACVIFRIIKVLIKKLYFITLYVLSPSFRKQYKYDKRHMEMRDNLHKHLSKDKYYPPEISNNYMRQVYDKYESWRSPKR